jgi:sugar lactone lactonase YvrE
MKRFPRRASGKKMRYRYIFISAALCAGIPAFGQPGVNQQLNNLPSRVLGHPNPEQLNVVTAAPNLVNGVEMWRPEGIALDTSANPPIVYVADTLNNRVLAWKNATSFSNGARADLVIGQNDMFSTLPQGPGSNTPAGLAFPTGMTVDSKGSLYVIDSGNNRVLRYPAPFSQKQALLTPDLVIG